MAIYNNNDSYAPYPSNTGSNPQDLYSGIANAYRTYLGRDARQDELDFHARTSPTNYEDVIRNSTEAQQWAARGSQPQQQIDYGQPQSQPLAYGGGADYNAPGGLQQSFWNTLGVTGGTGTITPGLLESKAGELSRLGIRVVSGDKIQLPDGTLVDVAGNYDPSRGGLAVWQDPRFNAVGGAANAPYTADGQTFNTGAGAGGGGGSASSSFSASSSGPQQGPLYDQLVQMLLQRAQQGLDVNRNSEQIRTQADPYAANVERQKRNYLADLAEKGGPLANLGGETRLANERAGQASGLFESQLIGREIEARRTEIQDALTQLGSLLTEQQRMSLQRELAQLDDATRRLQIDQQARQFRDQLGLQYNQFDWLRDPSNPNNIPNFNG